MKRILIIAMLLIFLSIAVVGVMQVTSVPLYASVPEGVICPGHIGDCPMSMNKCAKREDCHCSFFEFCVEDE